MNIFIKTFSVILVLSIFTNNIAFAIDWNNIILKCAWDQYTDYNLYKCQSKEICWWEEFWKSNDVIINLKKPYKENTTLEEIKKIYRKNQNSIYKCSILNSQEIAFKQLTKKLVKYTDKTGLIENKIITKIDQKLKNLQTIKDQNKCIDIEVWKTPKQLKKIVLDQSTLELCNYRFYLKYLNDSYYKEIDHYIDKNKKTMSVDTISHEIKRKQNEITDEIKHSYKMLSLSFDSYMQYDSFLKIHIILELLKEDYRTYRDKLYQTLHPINQLVYKIINAQSK